MHRRGTNSPSATGSGALRRSGSFIPFLLGLCAFAAGARAAEIHDLAASGELEPVRALLAEDPELLNVRQDDGKTPLHVAAYAGHDQIVQFLIGRGADLEATTARGNRPLHGASYGGHTKCMRLLIDAGAELSAANNAGYAPLHSAAVARSAQAMKLFLDAGVDINARKHGGETVLAMVALGDRPDLTRWLLEQGADLEVRDDYGRTALLLVARETGDVRIVQILVEHGADINARDRFGDTPLTLAAWKGFREVANLLLDRGAEVIAEGEKGRFLTSCAAKKGLARLFALLAEKGANLDIRSETGGSLLHSAAEGGSTRIAEALLERGLDINEADRYGWTPLHYAAKKGRLETAQMLIGLGADLDRPTRAGCTPCSLAREFNRNDMLEMLKEEGAAATPPIFPELNGPYFGQTPPGDEPQLLAVDIVSSNRFEHGSVTFSPDGTEAFWSSSYMLADAGYSYGRILTSRIEGGAWTAPRMADFSGVQLGDDVPLFSPDGTRLYFITRRPMDSGGRRSGEKVWFIKKTGDEWSEPKPIRGGPNSMSHHWQFGAAANGNIYIGSRYPGGQGRTDLYVSRFVDGNYLTPENLGPIVNGEFDEGSPFIAPDESYLIFTRFGDPADVGGVDLCVCFRDAQGQWTKPIRLPEPINTPSNEICPNVSIDGKYLFFNSFRNGGADIYWVSVEVIEKLKPEGSR